MWRLVSPIKKIEKSEKHESDNSRTKKSRRVKVMTVTTEHAYYVCVSLRAENCIIHSVVWSLVTRGSPIVIHKKSCQHIGCPRSLKHQQLRLLHHQNTSSNDSDAINVYLKEEDRNIKENFPVSENFVIDVFISPTSTDRLKTAILPEEWRISACNSSPVAIVVRRELPDNIVLNV